MVGDLSPFLCQSREDNVQGRPLIECVWKSPSTSLHGLDHSLKTPWIVLNYPLLPVTSEVSDPSDLEHPFPYHIQPQDEDRRFLEGRVGPCCLVESDFWLSCPGGLASTPCLTTCLRQIWKPLFNCHSQKITSPPYWGFSHWTLPGRWLTSYSLNEDKFPCSIGAPRVHDFISQISSSHLSDL